MHATLFFPLLRDDITLREAVSTHHRRAPLVGHVALICGVMRATDFPPEFRVRMQKFTAPQCLLKFAWIAIRAVLCKREQRVYSTRLGQRHSFEY
jgi:hypothetical protein